MQREKILLTGSTGFIGGALNAKLESNGFHLLNVVRSLNFHSSINSYIAEISPTTDWSLALKNIDVVIHAAGRAHVTKERSGDPLGEYSYHNVETQKNLYLLALSRFLVTKHWLKLNSQLILHIVHQIRMVFLKWKLRLDY